MTPLSIATDGLLDRGELPTLTIAVRGFLRRAGFAELPDFDTHDGKPNYEERDEERRNRKERRRHAVREAARKVLHPEPVPEPLPPPEIPPRPIVLPRVAGDQYLAELLKIQQALSGVGGSIADEIQREDDDEAIALLLLAA